MATIQGFQGAQFPRSDDPIAKAKYNKNNVQYATSSHQFDHDMFPGLIVQPENLQDVVRAVLYAKDQGVAIAVKSGGHQYSGASSTSGENIQLDLRGTFKNPDTDLLVLPPPKPPNENTTLVYASVSWSLGDLNAFLKCNKLFVPHGQCTDVHVGGHVQTGGYGQLARSFGLLGDHVWSIHMVDHNAQIKEVTKGTELFNAILGGSPGNFGVITHYTLDVLRDQDHDFGPDGPRPRGIKGIWLYSEYISKKLIQKVAEMAANPDTPRNFDLCVSVLSSNFPLDKLLSEKPEQAIADIIGKIPNFLGMDKKQIWPPTVILYAQWVPMNKDDKYDSKVDAWFQQFRDLDHIFPYGKIIFEEYSTIPMSEMTGKWLFDQPREFDYPYDKRTYMTNSTSLVKDEWTDAVADRIHQVVNPLLFLEHQSPDYKYWKNCWLSIQIQCLGGKHSQFNTNSSNGTSYSWRDSTVCTDMDCFHEASDEGIDIAKEWQAVNDKLMIGPSSPYSKQDKRVLWASYGDWNMENSWQYYYEDRAKYEKIGNVRGAADPNGTFTPNPFAVQRIKKE
jgi:hypothetical protein